MRRIELSSGYVLPIQSSERMSDILDLDPSEWRDCVAEASLLGAALESTYPNLDAFLRKAQGSYGGVRRLGVRERCHHWQDPDLGSTQVGEIDRLILPSKCQRVVIVLGLCKGKYLNRTTDMIALRRAREGVGIYSHRDSVEPPDLTGPNPFEGCTDLYWRARILVGSAKFSPTTILGRRSLREMLSELRDHAIASTQEHLTVTSDIDPYPFTEEELKSVPENSLNLAHYIIGAFTDVMLDDPNECVSLPIKQSQSFGVKNLKMGLTASFRPSISDKLKCSDALLLWENRTGISGEDIIDLQRIDAAKGGLIKDYYEKSVVSLNEFQDFDQTQPRHFSEWLSHWQNFNLGAFSEFITQIHMAFEEEPSAG